MTSRRQFLTGSLATFGSIAIRPHAEASRWKPVSVNLIPDTPSSVPNYWCTWSTQNYIYGWDIKELDVKLLEGNGGSELARDEINEELLIGANGWARSSTQEFARTSISCSTTVGRRMAQQRFCLTGRNSHRSQDFLKRDSGSSIVQSVRRQNTAPHLCA
jgi:hypothetical protein